MAPLKPAATKAGAGSGAPWPIVTALLAVYLAIVARDAVLIPFINDDFVFLDKTRSASFGSLWAPRDLLFHWYRPWSRELHYWTLQRLFGTNEGPFHLVSLALWLAVMMLFYTLARRLAGPFAAAVATAGVAALTAWGVPLLWIAGVQDLWMMLFALLALHALASGRAVVATVAFALALLSKETVATLPAVALVGEMTMGRRHWRTALARTAPWWGVVLVWAALHPALGGRLRGPNDEPALEGLHPPLVQVVGKTLASMLNLDDVPRPERGWGSVVTNGLLGALVLLALAAWGWRASRPSRRALAEARIVRGAQGRAVVDGAEARGGATGAGWEPDGARVVLFGLAWAAFAWAPLFVPTLGWHAYYALLGGFGAWLALAFAIARRPAAAFAIVAALALLRPARAATPSRDWGDEWYQRRASIFLSVMKSDLLRRHPTMPPHARLYFVLVPSNVGFLAGDGPALRVWYREPTLRAGYYPSYAPRAAGTPAGPDYFFRFDSVAVWVPVVPGGEDVAAARAANPRWERDHEVLAQRFAQADDWGRAAMEFQKLSEAVPENVDHAFNVGVSLENLGDSTGAARWYARASRRARDADPEVQEAARRLAHRLRTGATSE